ncbi:MAG TPA: aminodeoxychorismate synthase component I [Planctomycetaceae bacterium]|nr:aminodeoxychorismate synthase component I [Planctomycetaceae bacterium]
MNGPLVEELSPCPDVADAFAAFADQPGLLLLESALVREPTGRYSFLTADPFETFVVERAAFGSDPFEPIRGRLSAYETQPIVDLPPFQGGAAGLVSYELGSAFERINRAPHDEFQIPDLAVGLYDWVVGWDHRQQRAWLISHGFPQTSPAEREQHARQRLDFARQRLASAVPPRRSAPARSLPLSKLAPQYPAPGLEGLTSNFSREAYLRAVERTIEWIYAGDIFQANLSQRLLYPARLDAIALASRLRQCNPAPFGGALLFDDWAVVSASPERFLSVRDGEVETRPIKGTRRRPAVPEADLYTRDELRESEKDQAENVMIVDLLRNDLSRVCAPGSIRVPQLCGVETYETVQHLVSEVRGRLEDNRTVWDLWRAAFPGGSITGAPKVRAMEIIAELEPTVRGPYCGSLFYVGFDGSCDSNILIRTFVCRHGWISCGVGGGIVADSDPRAEYEETLHKAAGMLRAISP